MIVAFILAALVRRVAIKFLSTERARNPDDRARFVDEARAAAALDHRHICPVYEVNATADVPFIDMRFLDGETLTIGNVSRAWG